MFTSVNSRAAAAYKRVAADTDVQGADPHQLVSILFDALLLSLQQAQGALKCVDIAAKGTALNKAVRLLEEGLKAGLNMEKGGQLAQNLRGMYDYCIVRLTQANLRNDAAALVEVIGLIQPVADSWKEIKGTAAAALPASAAAGV